MQLLLEALTVILISTGSIGFSVRLNRKLRRDFKNAEKSCQRMYEIARHDLQLDSWALVLACQELAHCYDEETDTQPFGGRWEEVRKHLRKMVSDHEAVKKESFLIPIQEEK